MRHWDNDKVPRVSFDRQFRATFSQTQPSIQLPHNWRWGYDYLGASWSRGQHSTSNGWRSVAPSVLTSLALPENRLRGCTVKLVLSKSSPLSWLDENCTGKNRDLQIDPWDRGTVRNVPSLRTNTYYSRYVSHTSPFQDSSGIENSAPPSAS